MFMKADYTTPVDSVATLEQTGSKTEATSEQAGGETEEPAIVAPVNEYTVQEAAPQQKCAKVDFYSQWALLDFYFGGALQVLLLVLHLALLYYPWLYLALRSGGVESPVYHSYWRKQALLLLWHGSAAYTTTRKLLPWSFYVALSVAMICFYSYVVLAGGNPASKKAKAAA